MKQDGGFTIPELLLTLFIGAVFLATGYQLYGLILHDGATSRQQAMASDLAGQVLRQKMSDPSVVQNQCKTSSSTPSVTNPGLETPFSVTVAVTCPYGTSSQISNVIVTVKYGTNGVVTHASYAAQG